MITRLLFLAAASVVVACGPSETPTVTEAAPPSQTATPVATAPDPALKAFLETRTADAMAPLAYVAKSHGEGLAQITLVYLVGPEYCGSGGCNLLILGRQGDPYVVLGEASVVQAPVRILSSSTNGRPDIGVRVSGGGIREGYEAKLAFDGSRYPSNPTVAPAVRIDNAQGETLITDDDPRVTLKE